MGSSETAGIIRAVKACYEEPQNVSAKADYFDGIDDKMLLDSHYTGIATEIGAAKGLIVEYRKAILKAAGGGEGLVAARMVAELNVTNAQDALLAKVQVVANGDPQNSIAHITSLGISYRTREGYTRADIEVRHGEVSGSFDLLVKRPDGDFAVVWFFTDKPEVADSWRMADFSHNTRGHIGGLKRGTTYYFKAMVSSSKTGKSDWTYIVDKVCE
jgi:hypothetical protein